MSELIFPTKLNYIHVCITEDYILLEGKREQCQEFNSLQDIELDLYENHEILVTYNDDGYIRLEYCDKYSIVNIYPMSLEWERDLDLILNQNSPQKYYFLKE